ncbi:DUF4303 domain-containing protein [Pectobacterium carotovorum subsp. carotovorum]|uniref:DUF4303 domain-containing protein n=1 Tax=Pectobacterium carotovorum TaxID=554 RepID=UPI00202D1F17|nr:DUF4303 domain-containing protein [Pectobacterium carotovorum]MCL6332083.1 DUF4303 domain-containing protein [Pectobacterium carotovorum subsp. carotovorum]
MDWNKFEENCFKLTVKLIKKILSEKSNENFYAFSLYTDSSAMTVSLSANSEEKLKTILDADSDKSEENQTYYRWAISEWAYEGYESDLFSEISKELRLSSERESFSDFKNNLINSLTNALRRTNEEILKDGGGGVIMFVSITDDDDAEYIENMSSKIINSETIHDLFSKRYGDE